MVRLESMAGPSYLRPSYIPSGEKLNSVHEKQDQAHRLKVGPQVTIQRAKQPDIEWYPSYQTFQDRVRRLATLNQERPTDVPSGFPKTVDSARVWSGADFNNPSSFIVHLSRSDIQEIEAALHHFKGLPGENGPDQVTPETFPLPTLSNKLAEVAWTLHYGTGFAVLRGLNPNIYPPLDNVLLYLGVTSHIAEVRGCQDYDGRMIVHIKDTTGEHPEAAAALASPYSSRAQPFHTDRCDILSMYVQGVAATGGQSLLASSAKIYNEISATRPDVLHVLADDNWVFDEFITPANWHTRPLLYNFKEHGPSFAFSRRPLTGAPFSPHAPEVPVMTEEQAEALDMVHFIATKHQLSITLEPGDIEIFNNLSLFHARNGFVDDGVHKRHAIRLWLKNEKLAWQRPEQLLSQASELYDEDKFKRVARWDVGNNAQRLPHVLGRHMSCS